MGYTNGTPDLLIFEPRQRFHGLFIELKAEKGVASDDQLKFIAKASFNDYATAVCWGYEEAIKTIDKYLRLGGGDCRGDTEESCKEDG
jgi:hypothetical protein